MNKLLIVIFILSVNLGCKQAQKSSNEPIVKHGNAYGSTYSIVYYSEENFNTEIQQILDAFDASINTYIEDSNLTRFNKSENGDLADEILINLCQKAKQINQETDGFYEPSVMPLSKLWGFSKNGLQHSPSQKEVDSVLHFVGIQQLNIKQDSLLKKDARFALNFNSMTGYVNDMIGDFFNQKGIENYMIEIGGEILAHGNKPDNKSWTIGIDQPKENAVKRDLNAIVKLNNEALATSGNYRKFFIDKNTGQKIVHTINPKTGTPEVSALLSATVIHENCADADAIATSLMAMGLEKAIAFINKHKSLKVYLIWNNEQGEYISKGFNGFTYKNVENK